MANFFKGFFVDFYSSSKTGKAVYPRVDEIPYFFTWPLTFFLSKLNIQPTHVVFLSMVFGLFFLILFVSGIAQSESIFLCAILLVRILLDYVDGQLARYSKKTSILGALYDLTSDFLFTVLLFISIAFYLNFYNNISLWQVVPVCILGFFANVLTSTLASFTARFNYAEHQCQDKITQNFISAFTTDDPLNINYSRKVNLLNLAFKYTWRTISIVLFSLFVRNIQFRNSIVAAHLFSIFANSMHLFMLIFFILLDLSLFNFCIFEILLLILSYLFLLLFKLFSKRSAN